MVSFRNDFFYGFRCHGKGSRPGVLMTNWTCVCVQSGAGTRACTRTQASTTNWRPWTRASCRRQPSPPLNSSACSAKGSTALRRWRCWRKGAARSRRMSRGLRARPQVNSGYHGHVSSYCTSTLERVCSEPAQFHDGRTSSVRCMLYCQLPSARFS